MHVGVAFTLLLISLLTVLLNQYLIVSESLDREFWQVLVFSVAAGTVASFLFVALKDPGILRKDRAPLPGDESDVENMPYCDICSLYQPSRVVHCATCDCCIVGLDHHCPWIGKCVGKGNMFHFKLFNAFWISYFAIFIYIMVAS